MDETKCSSCHYFHQDHEDLPPAWRTGEHGLCVSPWRRRHVAHGDSTRCMYWTEREPRPESKPDIEDMSPGQLYAELDRLSEKKRQLGGGRDQYTTHTRRYYDERRGEVKAELRKRKLPVRKPGDGRTLATAAHISVRRALELGSKL